MSERPEKKWTDWQKWTGDLAKNVLTFGIISLVAVLWLDDRSAERDRIRFEQQRQWQAYFEKQSTAISNFSLESSLYLNAMDDAFLVAFNGLAYLPTHVKYAKMNTFEDEQLTDYGDLQLKEWHGMRWAKMESALDEMRGWFSASERISQDVASMKQLLLEIDKEFDQLRSKRPKGVQKRWFSYKTGTAGYGKVRKKYEKARSTLLQLAISTLYQVKDDEFAGVLGHRAAQQ